MQSIADIAIKHNIQAPSTIVVGKVVNVLLDDDQHEIIEGLVQNSALLEARDP
jgi:siroheme synthase